jgi:GNAT superfamily N-acetyltransferase
VSALIRLATHADAPAIAQVLAEAFEAYRPLYTAGGFAATTPGAALIAQRFGEGPQWVAEAEGVVLGTAGAAPKGSGLYVRSVAVVPAARGQGLGQALMAAVEAHALAQGFERLFLSTTPVLASAIKLYEGLGFVRSADGPHDLHGTPLFTMVKTLPAGRSAGRVPE